MLEKLVGIEDRYEELGELMARPEAIRDPELMRKYGQERASLAELVAVYREFIQTSKELEATREMLKGEEDQGMVALVVEEVQALEERQEKLLAELRRLLLPRDPRDEKSIIMEIRAGTGGEEAALFAADLYRMYTRYAERQSWATEILSSNPTGVGGFKEVIFQVKGKGAYSRLKYESGVHRVQRVPVTEAGGRIHTSTATVAVLPEVGEVEVHIDPDDLQVEVFRSSGHGGQSVNTTDSAVRLTHIPTGMVVSCQDERSQLQNRQRALSILRARLYDLAQRAQHEGVAAERRSQVGTGERSEKIRTYNFPQNRVTDHRLDLSLYKLESILDGEIEPFIEELIATDQAEKLRAARLN